jgi:hypothetical protein
MKKAILIALFALASAGLAMGQAYVPPQVDVLGAHNNQGRGCAGCHAPHSGSFGSGHGGAADAGSYALWGQDASPLYNQPLAFGDNGRYVEVLPGSISTGSAEVGGILLCLSCHDGNLTPSNMMTKSSYEVAIGLIKNTAYGNQPIPTLLGNDGTKAGNYTNDHPVGVNATLVSFGNPIQGAGTGITFAGNAFTVTDGTPYARFVADYGWPAIAPGKWGPQFGISAAGIPFVTCTTCHNQHVMTVYTSRLVAGAPGGSTIQADGGNKYYATYFFVNGPYNVNNQAYSSNQAPSTTQFCRQCHFGEANEANNVNNVTTAF